MSKSLLIWMSVCLYNHECIYDIYMYKAMLWVVSLKKISIHNSAFYIILYIHIYIHRYTNDYLETISVMNNKNCVNIIHLVLKTALLIVVSSLECSILLQLVQRLHLLHYIPSSVYQLLHLLRILLSAVLSEHSLCSAPEVWIAQGIVPPNVEKLVSIQVRLWVGALCHDVHICMNDDTITGQTCLNSRRTSLLCTWDIASEFARAWSSVL